LKQEDSAELQAMFVNCLGSHSKYLLYRYIMRRIARMVVERNRIPIVWDDLSWQGNYPEKSVVIQWHFKDLFDYAQQTMTKQNPSVQAVKGGHDAIVASASYLYFDYFDGGRAVKRLYEFDPVSPELTGELSKRIFGPQACLWECPQDNVDRMLFPRILALAEMGWTEQSLRKWDDFKVRLDAHVPELARRGVQYAAIQPEIFKNGFTEEWKPLPFREWHINESLEKDGTYEVRLELPESVTIGKAVWTKDGLELPLEVLESGNARCKIYRFNVTGVTEKNLYSVRLYFNIDGKPNGLIKGHIQYVHSESKE
jgi:hypothetical protein